jgi:hypothetical protein
MRYVAAIERGWHWLLFLILCSVFVAGDGRVIAAQASVIFLFYWILCGDANRFEILIFCVGLGWLPCMVALLLRAA